MKLFVAALTPIMVVVIGWLVNHRLKALEHRQWANQKLIEKRLQVFEDLSLRLNKLMCYHCCIGTWKELEPPQLIKLKRELDQLAYLNAPLFPPAFLCEYNKLIALCYATFQGWGQDAKLRTSPHRHQEAAADAWNASWDNCFADGKFADPEDVHRAYGEFVTFMAKAVGIGLPGTDGRPSQLPYNPVPPKMILPTNSANDSA